MHKICFTISLFHASTCFEHMCSSSGGQNCITQSLVLSHLALHSLWYHHTCRCDDTRGCVMQFWPPDDEHMCSKHVDAWNKTYCETKFCASSWLNTEINILRCTVSKTSKKCNILSRNSYNKTNEINSQIYFWNRTLHVLDSLSVHHRESSTVHTTICICHRGSILIPLTSCQQTCMT